MSLREQRQVESVALTQNRGEIKLLEAANAQIEQRIQSRDILYNFFTCRDGKTLASHYEKMICPMIMGQIATHRQLLADSNVVSNDRTISDQQLDTMETLLREHVSSGNDDMSRCFRQVMYMLCLYNEPQLRDFLIVEQPPPHPFPQSAEALAAAAKAAPDVPPLVDAEALTAFIKYDLIPAYEAIVTGTEQQVNLQEWICNLGVKYISRLPLSAGAPN